MYRFTKISIASSWMILFILTTNLGLFNANPVNSKSVSARDDDDYRCEWDDGQLICGYNCKYDDGKFTCSDENKLATGWIIAIVIVGLILTFGIPIGICFCCGCLCFKAMRRNKNPTTVYVQQQQPTVPNGAYPQQQGYPDGTYPQSGYPQGSYPQQQMHQPYPPQTNYGFVSNDKN